jgi:hypothetical protein
MSDPVVPLSDEVWATLVRRHWECFTWGKSLRSAVLVSAPGGTLLVECECGKSLFASPLGAGVCEHAVAISDEYSVPLTAPGYFDQADADERDA